MARSPTKVPMVALPRSSSGPVLNGHPWVYRDVKIDAPVGSVVQLCAEQQPIAWGLVDEGPIAVRVLGRGAPPERLDGEIAERIRRADAVRTRLVSGRTDCYRVISAAGDGLPGLILDRYGSLAVLRLYAKAWEPHLAALTRHVASLPWVTSVARRLGVNNVDGAEGLVHLTGEVPPQQLVVEEHGVKLLVRPYVGQKTGLFLDQREHRRLIGEIANGRSVVNLFAYNGGFSVYAALGGAARVVTVDLAPEAVADAREVFALNGVNPDDHGFEVADAFAFKPEGYVDLLIVDPPSLAHGKATERAAGHAYRKLHRRLANVVARDGLLATSSCTSRLSLDAWKAAIREGLAESGDWSWHWQSAAPADHPVSLVHPEGEYLKFALLRRR